MDDIYYQKYLKYKNKYLSLKANIDDQYAGANFKKIWKVKFNVTQASREPKGTPINNFIGDKRVEFGTVTDKRTRGGVTKLETNPYMKINGKAYEIKTFIIETFGGTRNYSPEQIIQLIKDKDTMNLSYVSVFELYESPCHSMFKTFRGNYSCNKNRGAIRMKFQNVDSLDPIFSAFDQFN